jgi:hypothetical protein
MRSSFLLCFLPPTDRFWWTAEPPQLAPKLRAVEIAWGSTMRGDVMKKLFLASVALIVLGSSAPAADLPTPVYKVQPAYASVLPLAGPADARGCPAG